MSETFGTYDYGLSDEQEARAAHLHDSSVICDMLFQGPLGYRSYDDDTLAALAAVQDGPSRYEEAVRRPIREALRGESKVLQQVWEESGITGGNRQASPTHAPSLAIAQAQFDTFPWLVKALTAGDIRRAKQEGRRAGYISTQNSDGIDAKLTVLQDAYDFGLRMLGLTYNTQNAVGTGCTERIDSGLSHFGAKLVRAMDDLGIIVDTAHSGKETTLDACRVSGKPVVASHTSAEGLYKVDRAKSDDELRAIADSGGVIGVVTVPFFLAPGAGVTIESVLDHIDYIADLVGWQHVAIGTDWPLQSDKQTLDAVLLPMCFDMGFREDHNLSTDNLVGFDDYRDFPNITRGLVARGYADDQVRGILGENFLRVFEAVCG